MHDYLIKASAYQDTVRVYVATTTDTVEASRKIHDSWPAATAALGRTLTATLIMGAMLKGDQTITVQIDGKGPIGKIVAQSNANGECRGVITNPHVHMSTDAGKLAVGEVVGKDGFIHVTKDLKVRDIFTSSSQLQSGEIGDDFTYYFALSEQIPSSVGLGVLVETDESVKAAGGFIIQAMPGITDETLEKIETTLKNIPPVSELINNGLNPEAILNLLAPEESKISETIKVRYACDCSRERFQKALIALGAVELDELIDEGKEIETVCQFCGKKYPFTIDDLIRLRNTK
ncbi:MAG: Hsp33 family molecular chaperone HslO [Bacilli bacterium]|nr:Hsp33 family molecular chaperone HslO [Bacilli bacterium]MBN2696637.1 Hsp33 family molecular chaperone HslO [Bacilli bacterium]